MKISDILSLVTDKKINYAVLDGYKSYIGGSIILLGAVSWFFHYIDFQQLIAVVLVGLSVAIYGIRHAIKKLTQLLEQEPQVFKKRK